jgi:hypothetical protein
MYEIIYENIGRMKVTGKVIIKRFSFAALNRVFKPYFGSTLEFSVNEETGEGVIYFGWHSQPFRIRKIGNGKCNNNL